MSPSGRRAFLLRTSAALAAAGAVRRGAAQGTGARPAIEMVQIQAGRTDEGALALSYHVRFELPEEVADALHKGVAVVFAARAEVFRERWYWSDAEVARLERRWRLAFQPLTRRWRVTFDGLSQHYDTLAEALGVMQRVSRWRLMDTAPHNDDRDHYIEFTFELDRNELPRPLQIGLTGQNEWTLGVKRHLPMAASLK